MIISGQKVTCRLSNATKKYIMLQAAQGDTGEEKSSPSRVDGFNAGLQIDANLGSSQ